MNVTSSLARQKTPIVVGAILVSLFVAIVVLVLVRANPTDGTTGATNTIDADAVDRLAADATSGEADRVRRAIVMPPGQSLDPAAIARLDDLSLSMDAATFSADAGVGTVRGTVTDSNGRTTQALFYLVQVDQAWLLSDVVPQ